MRLSNPLPFVEAIKRLAVRKVMPTHLNTRELQQIDVGIRQRSFFSARNTIESVLQGAKDRIAALVQGTTDPATVRLEIKNLLDAVGYQPDAEKRGTIEDLSSDKRIDLVVKTNAEIAQNFGYYAQGQDPAILDVYPALHFFRAEDRDKERDWKTRWMMSGQQSGRSIGDGWTITADGRMVALKNHPIWDKLGSTELWPDALDNPYPPFAFNSGMDVQDVTRSEAVEIGILDEFELVAPKEVDFVMEESAA